MKQTVLRKRERVKARKVRRRQARKDTRRRRLAARKNRIERRLAEAAPAEDTGKPVMQSAPQARANLGY